MGQADFIRGRRTGGGAVRQAQIISERSSRKWARMNLSNGVFGVGVVLEFENVFLADVTEIARSSLRQTLNCTPGA